MNESLVDMLTHRVRVFSLPQIVRAFGGGDAEGAEALIAELESEGFVERRSVLARPVLSMAAPVAAWHPGEALPLFGKIAYRLKGRWTEGLSRRRSCKRRSLPRNILEAVLAGAGRG